jgi:predicted deacylase
MAEALSINGIEIPPGCQTTVDLALPNLYTHTRMQMPVRVVRGRKPGPRLLVSAALHGDEINGVEIIRRLLAQSVLKRLRGSLITVPVVNVYGFITHSRYLPDRRDLNRSFPGSERGSLTSRLANLFLEEIVSKATHAVDLHSGAIHRINLPQIRVDLSLPVTREMAISFGAPVILDSPPGENTLRQAASQLRVPLLLYEGGEALRFDELAIRAGVKGMLALMRELQMLPMTRRGGSRRTPFIARSSRWVRAPQSGIMRIAKPLGARVEKDETLAAVSDPFGDKESLVPAPFPGIIIGRTNLPLVNEGEALFHVARVSQPGAVEEHVERYHEELADMRELADPAERSGQ